MDTEEKVFLGFHLVFPTGRTVQLFWTKGQKLLHCPGTKGQRDKRKILPRDGTGRGTKRDRAEKDVRKQENDVQKQEIW